MKFRVPIHLKAILTLIAAIFVFSVIVPAVSAPIPGQLYGWYILSTIVALLVYMSSTEASWEEFIGPFRALLLGRTALAKPLRIAAFIAVPLIFNQGSVILMLFVDRLFLSWYGTDEISDVERMPIACSFAAAIAAGGSYRTAFVRARSAGDPIIVACCAIG